ncbi:MAG: nuclease A inhibitor family protein [Cyanobacteria bacterium P01_A01_bin.83]
MNDNDLIEKLKQGTKDLLWLSESDYPWLIFYFANAAKQYSFKLMCDRNEYNSRLWV